MTRLEKILKQCLNDLTITGTEAHALLVSVREAKDRGIDQTKYGKDVVYHIDSLLVDRG